MTERPITYPPHTVEGVPHIPDVPPTKRKYAKRKKKFDIYAACTPRFTDPEILKLRAEHAAKMADYRKRDSSKRILRTIIEKRLSQLTVADRENLLDALKLNTTPALLPSDPAA